MKEKNGDSSVTEKEEQLIDTGEMVDFKELASTVTQKIPVNGKSQTSGFATHFQSELIRSAAIYLEQEDPKRRHREKVVCAVNVGDFELRYPSNPSEPEKMVQDGRTLRRYMWDEAVRALIKIVAETGLNPKYVRNDKNTCRLVMRQENITTPELMPDEFFSLELSYCSEFEIEKRKLEYVRRLGKFDEDISNCKAALFSWKTPKSKRADVAAQAEMLEREKQFFIATTPDPREMDSGLIFKIELFTLKEYGVTKEKLKTILNRFLHDLSKVAAASGTTLAAGLKNVA